MELELVDPILTKTPAEQLRHLWNEILEAGCMRELELPIEHEFEPGLYHRKATFPVGSIAVGRKHKSDHFNTIAHGKCLLWTSDGGEVVALEGPCSFPSNAGTRKVIYVLEELTWTTTHITDETTVEGVEAKHLYPIDYELDGICGLSGVEQLHIEETSL